MLHGHFIACLMIAISSKDCVIWMNFNWKFIKQSMAYKLALSLPHSMYSLLSRCSVIQGMHIAGPIRILSNGERTISLMLQVLSHLRQDRPQSMLVARILTTAAHAFSDIPNDSLQCCASSHAAHQENSLSAASMLTLSEPFFIGSQSSNGAH